jgi:hypothetical protein
MISVKPMVKRARSVRSTQNGVRYITRAEGKRILDRQARKQLGMSAEEFVKKYRAGELGDYDHFAVTRVSMLIPLGE